MTVLSLGRVPCVQALRRGADDWAIRYDDAVLSWGELDRRSTRRAWALKALGVAKDDLVTLALPNGTTIHEFMFAAWKLGATPHVVSWRLPVAELKAILEVSRPRVVIAEETQLIRVLGSRPANIGLDDVREDVLPDVIAT